MRKAPSVGYGDVMDRALVKVRGRVKSNVRLPVPGKRVAVGAVGIGDGGGECGSRHVPVFVLAAVVESKRAGVYGLFEEASDVVLLSRSSKGEILVSEEECRHFE